MIGRALAWIFIVLGLAMAGRDVVVFLNTGAVRMTALGQLWYAIDPGSLNLVQAVIERYVHPFLWDPIIFTVLLWPASLVFLVIGIALGLAFRKRRRRWRSGSFS